MGGTRLRITPHRKTPSWRRKGKLIRSRKRVGSELKTYWKKDIGGRGRGKKVIPPLKRGLMTELARDIDVIRRDETLMKGVSRSEMPQLARAMINRFGYKSAKGKAMARYVLAGGKKKKDKARAPQRRFFKRLHDEIVKQGRRK